MQTKTTMQTKLYGNTQVENMINKYIDKGGEVTTYIEGCLLGYGLAVCSGGGLKFCVLKEIYLNSWSSAYSIRFYNKLPKKYLSLPELTFDN